MSRQRSDEEIQVLLHAHISARDFPSAVYLVAERGQVIFEKALGDAVCKPVQLRAETETIYDLASLTKPLVTGLLCAKLSDRGVMNFDHDIARYLPEFASDDQRSITIMQLLTHTSGLAPWLPLRALTNDVRERALEVIASHSLGTEGNSRVVYSDLGFIILGFLLERLTNSSFAALADAEIFAPLGLRNTYFNPPHARRTDVAASETGNVYEDEMARRDYPTAATTARREEVIWGEVHDGNAYFLGGAAGHAGLFSNASETRRLAEQFIAERTALLKPQTCALFRTNLTRGLNEARSSSWQLALTADSTAGPSLPAESFGHTGFTGTSCWVDADRQRIFILLTNRTHNRLLPFANINQVRRRFHSLAVEALGT